MQYAVPPEYILLGWMQIFWLPLVLYYKFSKPGMSNWLFILFLLLDLTFLIDRNFNRFLPIPEYMKGLILAIQLVIMIIHRRKRRALQMSFVPEGYGQAVVQPPMQESTAFEAPAPIQPSKTVIEEGPVYAAGKKNIFINYRKEDSSGYSLALYHELTKWYDKEMIFKDFNTIEPGEDFVEAIDNALNGASVLIVIMGDKWNDILNVRAQKKHKDFVRIEIATALAKSIYTIPVTINNTIMPTEEELPEDLARLSHRQYLNIDQTRFETDVAKLVKILDKKLGIKRG